MVKACFLFCSKIFPSHTSKLATNMSEKDVDIHLVYMHRHAFLVFHYVNMHYTDVFGHCAVTHCFFFLCMRALLRCCVNSEVSLLIGSTTH